ncbi:MAG: hypothetical protein ACK5NK_02645 [Niabella sp.]
MKLLSTFILITAITTCKVSIAQNNNIGKAFYKITFRSEAGTEILQGDLSFNIEKSVFVYDKNTYIPPHTDTISRTGERSITVMSKGKVGDGIGKIIYTDFKTSQQISRDKIANKAFIIQDSIVHPDWEIGDQRKKLAT